MEEYAIALLSAMGIEASADDPVFALMIRRATQRMLTLLNRTEIPEQLTDAAAELLAGEYLAYLKNAGQLPDSFSLDAAVASIRQGDTTIQFSSSGSQSDEERLDSLIEHLRTGWKDEIYHYRRLAW